jgi:hypothetical protein
VVEACSDSGISGAKRRNGRLGLDSMLLKGRQPTEIRQHGFIESNCMLATVFIHQVSMHLSSRGGVQQRR